MILIRPSHFGRHAIHVGSRQYPGDDILIAPGRDDKPSVLRII